MPTTTDTPDILSYGQVEDKNDTERLIHIIPNLLFLCLLTTLFAFRIRNLSWKNVKSINFIRSTVLLTHGFGIGFILANVIALEGMGVRSARGCYSALIVCASFYLVVKILMYIFLIERAHVVSAPYRNRLEDKFWIACMMFLVVGVIPIIIMAFDTPIAQVSPTDGECRVGFPLRTTLLTLIWDVCMNILLSGVFWYLLYPYLSQQSQFTYQPKCRRRFCVGRGKSCRHQQNVFSKLRKLLDKTIIGSALMMIATSANIFVLLRMEGHQLVWFCFLMCPLDVTWTVSVVHWLTVDPSATDSQTKRRPKVTVTARIPTPAVHTVTCLSFPEIDTTHKEGSWCESETIFATTTDISKRSSATHIIDIDVKSDGLGQVSLHGYRRRSI